MTHRWILAPLTALALLGCRTEPSPPVEQELRRALEDMVDAIEAGDPERLMHYVAFDFSEEGGLDYAGVQSLVMTFLLAPQPPGARLENFSVEPVASSEKGEGEEVRQVRVQLLFTRATSLRDPYRSVPPGAVRYEIDLGFTRRPRGWQAVRGRYSRLSGATTMPAVPETSSAVPRSASEALM